MGSLRMINMTEQQRPCGSWLAAQNALLQSASKTEKQTGSYVVIWAGTPPHTHTAAIAPSFPYLVLTLIIFVPLQPQRL